jgi:RHS repeat-associated protein
LSHASYYKYTDQELDNESGLYNYDARMYDPVIGRFISADIYIPALYNPQALNRYSYCLNNPLIYTDPSGYANEATLPRLVDPGTVALAVKAIYEAAKQYGIGSLGSKALTVGLGSFVGVMIIAPEAGEPDMYSEEQIEQFRQEYGEEPLVTQLRAETNKNETENDSSKGAPVPGTGKKAGRAYPAKVKVDVKGKPVEGEPVITSKKPVKKSDATKEATRRGKFGGVVGSKKQSKQMGSPEDPPRKKGLPHTHAPDRTPEGHFWWR